MKFKTRALPLLTAAACVLLGTVAVAPSASAASGGGCSPWSSSIEGVSIQACINASGISVNADGYAHGSSSNCYIEVLLIDPSGAVIASNGTQSCSAGHHVGPSGVYWGTYHTEMCVWDLRSTDYRCEISPAINNP